MSLDRRSLLTVAPAAAIAPSAMTSAHALPAVAANVSPDGIRALRRSTLMAPTTLAVSASVPGKPLASEAMRALLLETLAAIQAESDTEALGEKHPEAIAARRHAQAVQRLLDDAEQTLWSAPVTTWDDVLARAHVAAHYLGTDRHGRLLDPDGACASTIAAHALVEAVLAMCGRTVR